MKVLSLFSGIGAFEKALDRLNIDWELVNFCEFDKYAVKSYCAIHGVDESKNLGDITQVDEKALPKDIDLITYGFPCQDISISGHQKGLFNEDGSLTRSGLFFEALRIIEETKPKVAIAENVKNLTSKKFNAQFQIVLESLEQAGYNNYYKVLNAKDFGIPQNRERVFIVSIRKDIDTGLFKFPEGFPLELRLKDMLEDVVDEKHFLNTDRSDNLIKIIDNAKVNENPEGVDVVGDLWADNGHGSMAGRVYNTQGLCPTLGASHFQQVKYILVREATAKGYAEAYEGDSINLEHPNSKTRRGSVGRQVAQTLTTSCNQAVAVAMRGRYSEDGTVEQHVEVSDREYANAITTVQKDSLVGEITESQLRIRKIIPKEAFRLQGFDDSDFEKAEAINSATQLYKQAGNSIVVACPYYIFKALIDANIFIEKEIKEMELRIENYKLPEKIGFNYEELKNELTERVSFYETLVYTDDQVKEAKNDRANLNKLKKALNDERIRMEKEYMVPFNDFKVKVNEIISIIDKPVAVIDKQVKAYEDKQKQDKADAITSYFNGTEHPEWLHLSQILDEKWLNASVSMKSVQDAIDARLNQIEIDLTTLHSLPEFGFEATQVYISTLDMNKAISEGHRLSEIQKKKAEYEAEQARLKAEIESREAEFKNDQKVSAPVEEVAATAEAPAKKWVAFQALLSTEDALALKAFFESRHIEFKAVR